MVGFDLNLNKTYAMDAIVQSSAQDYFQKVFPGFILSDYRVDNNQVLHLYLSASALPVCPKCLRPCPKIHARLQRCVKDSPRDGFSIVKVHFQARRVRCQCGCRGMEKISWISFREQITNRLAAMIQFAMRQGAPIAHVVKQFDVDWGCVKRLDKIQLKHIFTSINVDKVRHLIIDEFAVRKGHKYATVVMDADTHRVIWVGPGKSPSKRCNLSSNGSGVKDCSEKFRVFPWI